MTAISRLADRRPLVFGLLALLGWMALAALIVFVVGFLSRVPIINPFVQLAGTLGALGILLLIISRLGWIGQIGIANPGALPAWALTLVLAIYVVLLGWHSFFGEITFDLGSLVDTPQARAILLRTVPVAFVEETVFRGVLLYALVRVWGRTRRGLLAAVLVQAALFGTFHALQVLAGATPAAAIANVLATFVFGVWIGALVLSVDSLWPAVVLHAASNAFILIKGLSSPWVDPVFLAYLQDALLELPLVLLGLWLALQVRFVSTTARPLLEVDAAQ